MVVTTAMKAIFWIWTAVLVKCYTVNAESAADEDTDESQSRSKRQTTDVYNIQVLFVVDFAVYSWFSSLTDKIGLSVEERNLAIDRNITKYYAYVFNRTSVRYEGLRQSGLNIQLEFSGLIITKNASISYWTTSRNGSAAPGSYRGMIPAKDTLEDFESWVNETKSSLPLYDHVILFTGFNLTYSGSTLKTGLSRPEALCKSSSISVVEDTYDTRTVGIVAQEIGRSLGARLDLDGNFCLSTDLFIMTPRFKFPSAKTASNLWRFSDCSVTYFNQFIDGLQSNCLTDTSGEQYPEGLDGYFQQLPGEAYSADEQCKRVYGRQSYVCRSQISDYSAICRGLSCFVPTTMGCEFILPDDGTVCGNRSMCLEGFCQKSSTAPEVPDKCPYGDQPLPFDDKCSLRISRGPYECYVVNLRQACCDSCAARETGAPGCEYGDRIGSCQENNCAGYEASKRTSDCCLSCNSNITTRAIATTTAMATTTTSAPVTTTSAFASSSPVVITTPAPDISTSTAGSTTPVVISTSAPDTTTGSYLTEELTTSGSLSTSSSPTDNISPSSHYTSVSLSSMKPTGGSGTGQTLDPSIKSTAEPGTGPTTEFGTELTTESGIGVTTDSGTGSTKDINTELTTENSIGITTDSGITPTKKTGTELTTDSGIGPTKESGTGQTTESVIVTTTQFGTNPTTESGTATSGSSKKATVLTSKSGSTFTKIITSTTRLSTKSTIPVTSTTNKRRDTSSVSPTSSRTHAPVTSTPSVTSGPTSIRPPITPWNDSMEEYSAESMEEADGGISIENISGKSGKKINEWSSWSQTVGQGNSVRTRYSAIDIGRCNCKDLEKRNADLRKKFNVMENKTKQINRKNKQKQRFTVAKYKRKIRQLEGSVKKLKRLRG